MGLFNLPAVLANGIQVVPTVADLPVDGVVEGAIRYAADVDALYTFDGSVWNTSSGVQPPSPAITTDNAVARWDGAIGAGLNNSGVIIDDSDNITGVVSLNTITSTEINYLDGVSSSIQTQLNDKVDDSEKGAALGVATLDGGGKVPAAQLPNSIMDYLGNWSAATNTPTLANGTGNTGDVYQNTAVGTVDFGAGNITFAVGDFAIYNGTIWEKSLNSNAVVSVNGLTGIVTAGTVGDTSGASSTVGSLLFVGAGQTIAQDNASLFWDNSNDRLGLGTAAPNEQLELTKSLRIPATTASDGIIKQGTARFIHSFGTTDNTFVGKNAGNLTNTGSYNTGIGSGALGSLSSGITNTALGFTALADVSTGTDNTAVGQDALRQVTGTANIGIGNATGYTVTTGGFNTFIGFNAGLSAPAALSGATVIGRSANATSNDSVVLGGTNVGLFQIGTDLSTSGQAPTRVLRAGDSFGTDQSANDLTIQAATGTGTGAGGSLLFKTAPAGSTGSTLNTPTTALTIDATGKSSFDGAVAIREGGAAPSFYTTITGGDQAGDISWTLPTAQGAASTRLNNNGSGVLSWTAVTASEVGLGNVDNTSDATKNAAAVALTNHTIDGNSNTLTVLAGTQLSGQTPIANGGTGASTAQAAINALAGATTDNRVLQGNGTNIVLGQIDDPAFFTTAAEATQSLPGVVKSAGQLLGTNTNDAAAAGYVGEYVQDQRVRSSGLDLTTATAQNVFSTFELDAGDWDISGAAGFDTNTNATITELAAAVSLTSGTMPSDDTLGVPTANEYKVQISQTASLVTGDIVLTIPTFRVSIAANNTPVYLVVRAVYSTGDINCYGSLWARRVR